jgi:hypothetical protein
MVQSNMARNPFDVGTQQGLNPLRKPSPFQQAFRTRGLGGQAQQARITQLGKRRQEAGDIMQRKLQGERDKLMGQLTRAKEETASNIQEQRMDIQRARQFAQEDVQNELDQMMFQRQRVIQDLGRRREELRRQLQGVVDEETLAMRVGAFDDMIGGLTQGGLAMVEAFGGPKARGGRVVLGRTPDVGSLPDPRPGVDLGPTTEDIRRRNMRFFSPSLGIGERPTPFQPVIQTPLYGEGAQPGLLDMAPPRPVAFESSMQISGSITDPLFARMGIGR